jgi:3-(3-hydroxy-phenyl)propionate hydroxylase
MAGGRRKGVVGTMFPQPTVAGRPLDDLLGPDFAVIGPGVTQHTVDTWQGPRARFLRVVPSVLPAGGTPADGVVEEVADDTLTAWFTRHRARLAVLRPDRFVYATATDDRAPSPLVRGERGAVAPVATSDGPRSPR